MFDTPYVPHLFGDAAQEKLRSTLGWLTAGVASSIPWPQEDVWVLYDRALAADKMDSFNVLMGSLRMSEVYISV